MAWASFPSLNEIFPPENDVVTPVISHAIPEDLSKTTNDCSIAEFDWGNSIDSHHEQGMGFAEAVVFKNTIVNWPRMAGRLNY